MSTEQNQLASLPEAEAPQPPKFLKRLQKIITIKVALIILGVVVVLGLLFYFKGLFVAALVNNKPVTRIAVIKELERQSGLAVLDALINEELIDAEAVKQNIKVSEQEIDDRIKTLEDQFSQQGTSLADALKSESLSKDDLKKQITLQKKAELILADKVTVTDAEIDEYIKTNDVKAEAGQEDVQRNAIKEQIKATKFSQEIGAWLSTARTEANIIKFVNY